MSKYGSFQYTTSVLYGPTGQTTYRAEAFNARSRAYGSISLSWSTPQGSWNRIRLVRSSYGFPAYENDGTVLVDSNSGSSAYGTREASVTTFDDFALVPGKFYYYSLFVEYSSGSQLYWARSGDVMGLSVRDNAYLDLLLSRLPSIYTTDEQESNAYASNHSSGVRRFLAIPAFDLAHYRSLLDALSFINDPEQTPGPLLPSMAGQLSSPYEPEIGMRQNRVLLRNATYLAARKCTALGLTGLVSSVTGYGAVLEPLRNLLHDENDANAGLSTGRWVATGGTLARNTSTTLPTDNAYTQRPGAFSLTATGTGMSVSLYDDNPVGTGIPVMGGGSYVFSVYLQSPGNSRTPNLIVNWYKQDGTLLSTSSSATSATTSSWARYYKYLTAPTGATHATLGIAYPTTVVNEVQFFKSVQFEPSKNLLSPAQAGFEDGTTGGWTVGSDSGASIANSTTVAYAGTHSLRYTASTGTSEVGPRLSLSGLTVGKSYTLSLRVFQGANLQVRAAIYDQTAGQYTRGTTATYVNLWTLSSVTFVPQGSSVDLIADVPAGLTSGTQFYIDAVQVEQASAATPYVSYPTAYNPARLATLDIIAPRINEVANSSFTADTSGWSTFQANSTSWAGSLARVTSPTREGGIACGKITTTTNGAVGVQYGITLDPNRPLTLSGYVTSNSATAQHCQARVDFYDVSGASLGSSTGTLTALTNANYTRVSVTTTTPATAVSANVVFIFTDAVTTSLLYLVDVLAEHLSYLDDYYDTRTQPANTLVEAGTGRTHLYPLRPYRSNRASDLATNSVMLGTEVALIYAKGR